MVYDRTYVELNTPEGMKLNPNENIVSRIIKALNRTQGECPCVNDSEDKHCACTNARKKKKCCCGLYV